MKRLKRYADLKIKTKLITGFNLVAIIALAVGIVGYIGISSVGKTSLPSVIDLGVINTAQIKVLVAERGLINDKMSDPELRQAQYAYIENALSDGFEAMERYENDKKSADEAALWAKYVPLWDAWEAKHEKVMGIAYRRDDLVERGYVEGSEVIQREDMKALDASLTAREAFLESEAVLNELVELTKVHAQEAIAGSTILIILFALLGVVMSIVAGIAISNMIANPIKDTVKLARELSTGNLDHEIKIKYMDEAGQLAKTIDEDVRTAFKTIEEAQIVAEKQSEYQSKQVDRLVVNLEKLSAGTLECDMAVDDPDEETQALFDIYSNISDNLHYSIDTIKSYIDDISYTLSEMAAGNLKIGITSDYKGEFIELKESINRIIASFNSTLSDINTAAEQVASGTSQVSDGNQEISQGATEQASSIEELSASITQMAEQIKQNAENANASTELAIKARDVANDGNEKMSRMLQSMDEINESSSNISKIIKVIDDIAFQTNILALNAAVEAARAGTHGKGFAVVAEEVRNLAARSADAAKETTTLIEGSIKKVEQGTEIANDTATSLSTIVDGSKESARLLNVIATASNEQATGISQINRGIEQLSQVVQTNSATAEEGAAASEELSSQAELLKTMIAKFKLKDETEQSAVRSDETRDYTSYTSGESDSEDVKPKIVLNDSEFGKY